MRVPLFLAYRTRLRNYTVLGDKMLRVGLKANTRARYITLFDKATFST